MSVELKNWITERWEHDGSVRSRYCEVCRLPGNYVLRIYELEPPEKHRFVKSGYDENGKWYRGDRIMVPMHSVSYYWRGHYWGAAVKVGCTPEEIPEIIENFKKAVSKHKEERKIELQNRRALNEMYPKLTTYNFTNGKIRVIEEVGRYDLDCRSITVYVGEQPVRGTWKLSLEKEFTVEDVAMHVHTNVRARYNVRDFSDIEKCYRQTETFDFDFGFIGMYEFIGSVVWYKGEELWIKDLNFDFGPFDFREYEIMGAMQGIHQLSALMNKVKYYE